MERLYRHPNRIDLINGANYFVFDNKLDEKTEFVNENNERWTIQLDVKEASIFIDNERFIMNNSEKGIKKCDWICFNPKSIYFIEAKDVKTKNRGDARIDFDKKMIDTINFYKKYNLNKLQKFAILNFSSPNKITRAAKKERKYKYKELEINYEELNYLEVI